MQRGILVMKYFGNNLKVQNQNRNYQRSQDINKIPLLNLNRKYLTLHVFDLFSQGHLCNTLFRIKLRITQNIS